MMNVRFSIVEYLNCVYIVGLASGSGPRGGQSRVGGVLWKMHHHLSEFVVLVDASHHGVWVRSAFLAVNSAQHRAWSR